MSEISHINGNNSSTAPSDIEERTYLPAYVENIFQHLAAQDVEQFYKSYHFWSLQRRIGTFQTEIDAIQEAVIDNSTLMQQTQPSAIALASLAQLQASGVSNLDLLDRMLERGETWLDHTMQLLEQCEKLDVIRGDYTQWCEHALEGAYTWIASMEETDTINAPESDMELPPTSDVISDVQQTELQTATEEQLLQKLMSDEEATEKIPALPLLNGTVQEITEPSPPSRKITQPLQEITEPSPLSRKITQPLQQFMPADSKTAAIISQVEEVGDSTTREALSKPSEQIDTMKDIVATSEKEEQNDVVQEADDTTRKVATISKDAHMTTIKVMSEERVLHKEIPDQTGAVSSKMIESQSKDKKGFLAAFWRFLSRVLASFYRKH